MGSWLTLQLTVGNNYRKVGMKSLKSEWTGPESNWRHTAFQAVALPTELPVPKIQRSQYIKIFFPFKRLFANLKKEFRIQNSECFKNSKFQQNILYSVF